MRINMSFVRDIIRCIDRLMPDDENFSAMPDIFLSQPELEKYQYSTKVLHRHLDYCNQQGYFCEFEHYLIGFGLRDISQKGYDFLDGRDDSAMSKSASTFNFNNTVFNNSAVGEKATVRGSTYGDNALIDQSITNSLDVNLSKIEKLISAKPVADQEQLAGLLELLQKASTQNAPIKKGLLAKFSDGLKKHTDIITAIGDWAVQILLSGQ